MQKELIEQCLNRIKPFINRTPVFTSSFLNEMVQADLYFKCENFQKTGSFKMRGAVNSISQLSEIQLDKGVVTHSSGNFAQALSLAARNLGVKAYIVMPENTPLIKKDAVKLYGGEIIECKSTIEERQRTTLIIEKEKGATFIHPSNNFDVIIGQSTACKELLEDVSGLNFVFTPVGGGGLIAGTSLSSHFFGNKCSVFGGEPLEVDDAYCSLKSGIIESNKSANTIADGLKTVLGDINFPIIQKYVSGIIRVSEIEIVRAMRLIWERMKIVVEPSSAVALAAIIKEKTGFKNKKIGIIISGGNVDLENLPF